MNTLLPFQKSGVEFLASKTEALLADDMGLGKTIQTIVAAERTGAQKILVVCPASLKINWVEEFRKWSDYSTVRYVSGRNADIRPNLTQVLVINYDLIIHLAIYRQIISTRWDLGVFDECQALRGRTSKRTKAVLKKYAIASCCSRKWFLTGTPILNRPVELFPILKAVSPKTIDPYLSYTSYARHFCEGYWNGSEFIDKGATHIEELEDRFNIAGLCCVVLRKTYCQNYRLSSTSL